MPLTFPSSPSVGDTYTVGARTWTWTGTIWEITGTVAAAGSIGTTELANNAVTVAKIEANPTFTGTVTLPSTTSIGTVSSTELGYVDGVTSAIQTQLDSKLTATTALTSNRNVIINGDFKIWQRGNARTKLNAGSYLADRWGPILFQSGAYERVAGRATQYARAKALSPAIAMPAASLGSNSSAIGRNPATRKSIEGRANQ